MQLVMIVGVVSLNIPPPIRAVLRVKVQLVTTVLLKASLDIRAASRWLSLKCSRSQSGCRW